MIRPPRRSVTRFFIPLIDVLILLFCVFLLMPFVGTPDATADPDADPNTQTPADNLRAQVLQLQLDLAQDFPDDRQEVRDQADAQRLIDQARRTARGKDVFFLMLYPRVRSGFPEQPQVESYSRWFQGVPHGFDNPWGQPAPANVKETP
jgi:hypothetical protein